MCGYCDSPNESPVCETTDYGNDWFIILIDNVLLIDIDCNDGEHGGQRGLTINYCPFCGEKLKES